MNTTNDDLKVNNWGWPLTFGIILMLIGIFLLTTPVLTTLTSVFVFAVLLIFGGLVHLIAAFFDKHSEHYWLHLVLAIFTIVIGVLLLRNPGLTVMALTLLIAAFFLSDGLFRIIGSLTARFQGWGWYLLNGIVSLLLGILILAHWPSSSLWVIGLFIGIDFIFAGLSLAMISLYVKKRQLHSS